MKRKAVALTLVLTLLFSALAGTSFVKMATSNPIAFLPEIVIKSDGSVEPETEFIKQTGTVYSLTADLSQQYAIVIQRSNIVFDGGGHTINGSVPSGGVGWSNIGVSLEHVTNVTVKNVEVSGFSNRGIALLGCSNCSITRVKADSIAVGYNEAFTSNFFGSDGNTIVESIISSLGIMFSYNNVIARNSITDTLSLTEGNSNTFFENNFVSGQSLWFVGLMVNFWDNGSVGNYWSDYQTKYPNASENGNSGIGDTPYVIDANNTDNYPLMAPFEVPPLPEPEPEAFPVVPVVVSVAVVAAVGAGLLVYFKKRKH